MAAKRRKRRKRFSKRKSQRRIQLYTRLGIGVMVVLLLYLAVTKISGCGLFGFGNKYVERTGDEIDESRPDMDVQLLTVNE